MFRQAVVAGLSYEQDKTLLEKQIERSFTSQAGPGDLPVSTQHGIVHAAILPNGPYPHSGPCAAWGFKELAESEPPSCYLILGTSPHVTRTCLSANNFTTPLGTAE